MAETVQPTDRARFEHRMQFLSSQRVSDDELAEAAHDAWLAEKRRRGVVSWPNEAGIEQMVPYAALDESIREFDRVVVRAIIGRTDLLAEVERLNITRFSPPLGDNHHNAAVCPYCSPDRQAKLAEITGLRTDLGAARVVRREQEDEINRLRAVVKVAQEYRNNEFLQTDPITGRAIVVDLRAKLFAAVDTFAAPPEKSYG